MKLRALTPFLLLACGTPPPTELPTEFIAFARDFEGYEAWEHFDFPGVDGGTLPDGGPGTFHTAPDRRVFLNHRPDAGATAFPMGTIIVKEMAGSVVSEPRTFAMAKQGGTFNSNGAKGWRFYELARATNGQLLIVWQGFGPPAGEKYGGTDTCNGCHAAASATRDSILSPPLDVSSL